MWTYMSMFRQYNAKQSHIIKIPNKFLEKVSKFKYLGTTVTNQNCMHEEIKNRLNSGSFLGRSTVKA
jgi:hypothetical protein